MRLVWSETFDRRMRERNRWQTDARLGPGSDPLQFAVIFRFADTLNGSIRHRERQIQRVDRVDSHCENRVGREFDDLHVTLKPDVLL